jgi:hypothetical protein
MEIEIDVLRGQCLSRRIGGREQLVADRRLQKNDATKTRHMDVHRRSRTCKVGACLAFSRKRVISMCSGTDAARR